jgi:long-chain acyl-CoA synthetase
MAAMKATRQHGVTFLPTVPAYIRGLTKASKPPRAPATLRRVITAGAPLKPQLAADFRRIYGQPIHVFYGASECGGISYDREGGAGERGSLGTPVDGVEIELEPLSSEDAGQHRGVVNVRSPAVASGYLPQTEDSLSGGRFRTADLAQWVDGELYVRGRIDNIINIKGKKIHPREIEEVLARHPQVSEVVVMPVADESGTVLVRALVVPRDDAPGLSERLLREHCQLELPSYKVPRSIVVLRELPLTERGKIDRRQLSVLDLSSLNVSPSNSGS